MGLSPMLAVSTVLAILRGGRRRRHRGADRHRAGPGADRGAALLLRAAVLLRATLTPPALRRGHSGRRGVDAGARVYTTTGRRIIMALDCILAVRLSAALDCLTPATTGTSRDPKTRRSVTSILQRGVISILRLKRVAYLALRKITARLVAVDRSLWRSGILCGREFRRPTSQQGDRRKRGRTACCGLQSVELFRAPGLRCACIAPEPKTDVSGGAGIE
jgi:hypothetical protein